MRHHLGEVTADDLFVCERCGTHVSASMKMVDYVLWERRNPCRGAGPDEHAMVASKPKKPTPTLNASLTTRRLT